MMNLRLHTVLTLALALLAISAYATPAINLGTAAHFGLLGGAGVTNNAVPGSGTVINGDVGSAPTPSVTGFPTGIVNGTLYTVADDATAQAHTDLIAAYNAAAGATATSATDLTGTNLGTLTLGPGVYFCSSSAQLTGDLTLDAGLDLDPQWIFKIGSTLTTAANARVLLINGATPSDVFWQVGSSATLGADNVFAGNIMANANIALGGGTLNGRALAITEAVTISAAQTVNVPEPSSIMALGMMLTSAAVLLKRKK
jgi:hypothetical protein